MKILLYICLFSLVFLGCKKYPEDRKISLNTPFKRLTKHNWKLDRFLIDGLDSSSREYYGGVHYPSFVFKGKTLDLTKEKAEPTYKYSLANLTPPYGIDSWKFESDKKEKILFGLGGNQALVFRINEGVAWEIEKLTSKELIIKAESNGRIHKVEFIKE